MSNKPSPTLLTSRITVAARSSPLSQVQVKEVLSEAQKLMPELAFDLTLVTTIGDRDQQTSLRSLDETDFFTRDIDQLLLSGQCRIAVHSAKDLPDPIPEGLKVIAVTEGEDPSDSLVLREGDTIAALPEGAVIATSSERREQAVRSLRNGAGLTFVDIRGNIGQRLRKLESGEVDGVVIAEAAIIRLNLTRLNRERLPGKTALGQGKLAVIAREDDAEIAAFFAQIDKRSTAVYLGLEPPQDTIIKKFYHCPVIEVVSEEDGADPLPLFTHIIFTSKSTVRIFCSCFDAKELIEKTVIAIGKQTARELVNCGVDVDYVPNEESSEGIIALLGTLNLSEARMFWPHSKLSRPVIAKYLQEKNIPVTERILYNTVPRKPISLPTAFDELIFTSPSTVDAFLHFFKTFPDGVRLTPIGPVTERHLKNLIAADAKAR